MKDSITYPHLRTSCINRKIYYFGATIEYVGETIMASVSVKMPDNLKRQIEERSQEEGYMNTSEYIRQAVREKIKEETQLYPDELRRLIEQGQEPEEGKSHSLEEVKEEFR